MIGPRPLPPPGSLPRAPAGTAVPRLVTLHPIPPSATISGLVSPRPNHQTLTAETLSYSDHVSVTYTLELKEFPPLWEGWARQGAAPAPPQIRVTTNSNLSITVAPMPGDVAPSVSVSWNGLGSGTLSTTVDRSYSSTQSWVFPGRSYTATGDLDGQIALPSVYAGSASLWATFGYSFAMEGITSGTSTYTRQVPGPHTPSSVPEPREWAMLAGLPLAAFACARRLRLHRRQR